MCLQSEVVESLHEAAVLLRAVHEERDAWINSFDVQREVGGEYNESGAAVYPLHVTRAEAERIFADRIATQEARLKELGWERKVRVEQGVAV